MLSDEQKKRVGSKFRLFQLVPCGMILFVIVFALFVYQIGGKAIGTGPPKMLTMFACFAAFMMYAMSAVIPRVFSGKPIPTDSGIAKDEDVDAAFGTFTVESLIRFALIAGAAFMNLLVFIVEPHVASLTAAGFAAVLMLAFFPRFSNFASVVSKRMQNS